MPQTGRAGPSLRVLLGATGGLALVGPLLVVVVVGWIASPLLALAAGLAVSLLLTMGLLAGGWWLICRLEDLAPPAPLSAPERGAPDTTNQSPEPRTQNLEPRVLLVEDDPITQRIVARWLQQLGVEADVVGDGQAALEAVAAHEYALVLMDCQLPVMDGYAAAAEIRRREAVAVGTGRLPIVALTASTLDADRERALAAGMDGHMTKPLDVDRLAALLARWGLHHTGRQASASESRADRPPVLDPAGLPTVNGRLSEPYREIVQLYRQEAVRRMAALGAAASLPDRLQAARIAHTLAGSSSSIGASRMAAACAALEALAKEPASETPLPSAGGRADAGHAGGDRALAEAVGVVRRELEQLDAALAHLTAERPPL